MMYHCFQIQNEYPTSAYSVSGGLIKKKVIYLKWYTPTTNVLSEKRSDNALTSTVSLSTFFGAQFNLIFLKKINIFSIVLTKKKKKTRN